MRTFIGVFASAVLTAFGAVSSVSADSVTNNACFKFYEDGTKMCFALSLDGTNVVHGPIYRLPRRAFDKVGHTGVVDVAAQPMEIVNACGFYLIEGGFPTLLKGQRVSGWKIIDNLAYPQIADPEGGSAVVTPDPSPAKTYTVYSKLKLCIAIASLGKWEAFDAWLSATTLGGLPLKVAFDQCQYLRSDHELFEQGKAAAAAALGLTAAQIDQVLAASVDTES